MANNTITISGWGQQSDSLSVIAPDAQHLSYVDYEHVDAWLESLTPAECDCLIGWSQGGQLALKAVSEGLIKPQKLVLLAAPYQFVAGGDVGCGMLEVPFQAFCYQFESNAERALKRFALMVAHNDTEHKAVQQGLKLDVESAQKWEHWLEYLGEFVAQEIDFSAMPEKTLLVHGLDDVVVESNQTSVFMPFMPHAQVELWQGCAHAPHLHDPTRLKQLIEAL